MHVGNISNATFGASKYLRYLGVPEELQKNKPLLEKFAKDNSVTLSISTPGDSKYLPNHNSYTIVTRNVDKPDILEVGIALTDKTASNESVLEKIEEKVALTILKLQSRVIALNSASSEIKEISLDCKKTKQTFGQKIKGLFKQLLKK